VAFCALLDYDELNNLRVRFGIFRLGSILNKTASPRRVAKGVFDQISCFDNFLSGCDICLARLFFRVGMNVLLSPKAERPPETHHDCARFFEEAVTL
jgi:hypothetical protein